VVERDDRREIELTAVVEDRVVVRQLVVVEGALLGLAPQLVGVARLA
jgi:hypothetical protein